MNLSDDDSPELWRQWLPRVHRALARPDREVEIPGIRECRDLQSAQAYWECLEYLLSVLIGWEDIGAGLAWWFRTGKNTQGDERLELVQRHWNDEGQLNYFAAHHWRGPYSYFASDDLPPTDLSLQSRYRDLEWWRELKARGQPYSYDPFFGGSNPLHLGASGHACLLTPPAPPTGFRGSPSVRYPSGVVVVNDFKHWRNDLYSFSSSLPEMENRSWRIEVFDRREGFLGLFRKSRDTGQWFQGRHSIHCHGRPQGA